MGVFIWEFIGFLGNFYFYFIGLLVFYDFFIILGENGIVIRLEERDYSF